MYLVSFRMTLGSEWVSLVSKCWWRIRLVVTFALSLTITFSIFLYFFSFSLTSSMCVWLIFITSFFLSFSLFLYFLQFFSCFFPFLSFPFWFGRKKIKVSRFQLSDIFFLSSDEVAALLDWNNNFFFHPQKITCIFAQI